MPTLDVTDDPTRSEAGVAESPGGTKADWLAGRPTTRRDVAIAVAMGAVVVAISYAFRSIIVPTDPWHYVREGMQFPSKQWVPLGYTRYGIVLPSGVVGHIFGKAPISFYFWPLVSSGALAAGMALLARRFWGWPAAVIAIVLLLTNRVVFYNLSRGYPDIMGTSLFVAALVLALLARDRLVAGGRAWPWLLAVGFLLGWGFEVRESSLMAWPLLAIVLWVRGKVLRTVVTMAIPLMAWAALDIGVSWLAYGDPLLKLHILSGLGGKPSGQVQNTASIADHTWFVGQSRWFYLTFVPRTALHTAGGVWMVGLGALALLAAFVRNGGVRMAAAWFVIVYLCTVAPTGLLQPFHPRGRIDVERYWIPFFPPIALAVAGLVAVVGAWAVRRTKLSPPRWVPIATVLLGAAVAWGPVTFVARYATSSASFAPSGADALEEVRAYFAQHNRDPREVWTDWETKRILPIYQREFFGGDRVWSGTVQSLTGRGAPGPGDYVVLFGPNSVTCSFCSTALAPWTAKHPGGPPSSWEKVFTSEDDVVVVYRVP